MENDEKTFLLIEERGNGYLCSCCRDTWLVTEEFDSLEALTSSLEHLHKVKEDVRVEAIYEISKRIHVPDDLGATIERLKAIKE